MNGNISTLVNHINNHCPILKNKNNANIYTNTGNLISNKATTCNICGCQSRSASSSSINDYELAALQMQSLHQSQTQNYMKFPHRIYFLYLSLLIFFFL